MKVLINYYQKQTSKTIGLIKCFKANKAVNALTLANNYFILENISLKVIYQGYHKGIERTV